jgi:hypothetical protein
MVQEYALDLIVTPCSGIKRNSKRLIGLQPRDFPNAYSTQDIQNWKYSQQLYQYQSSTTIQSRAFASKDKLNDIADFDKNNDPIIENGAIVYVTEKEISMDVPVTLTNFISFFDSVKLQYNDGNVMQDIVTFAGADFVDDMQIKCKIKLSDDRTILVDPEMLNFIENPDIASSNT